MKKKADRNPPAQAAIVAIGDELLHDRKDTNSQMIQDSLKQAGLMIGLRVVAPDQVSVLADVFLYLMGKFKLIVCCGGLGPTVDDITRIAVARATKMPLQPNPEIQCSLEKFFQSRGIAMPASNNRQALIPRGARILANDFGTAPGFFIQKKSYAIAVLPGPPSECLPMLRHKLLPLLKPAWKSKIFQKTIRVCGFAESYMQEVIGPVFEGDSRIQLGFLLDTPGEILIKLTATSKQPKEAMRDLTQAGRKISKILGESIVDLQGKPLPVVVGQLLRKQRQTVSVAESCTGGLIASRITDVPGCSDYFLEGIVTYSNRAKQAHLGVSQRALERYGAVSRVVALQMAKGVRKRAQTDWGLAITGLAGPGGGSKTKPVGLVYAALTGPDDRQASMKIQLPGSRTRVRAAGAAMALDFLRRALQNKQ
ncbi:CinA family nicotinamide mononucleotide deamidase-related protein [bacterium]|nr:CinA family nicotinamide mononucleotide deamidase-related protein [bacterium]